MSEQEALVAAVEENRGEDLPLLVYADWVGEGSDEIVCDVCVRPPYVGMVPGADGVYGKEDPYGDIRGSRCPFCLGTTRLAGNRRHVLAESIRAWLRSAHRNDFWTWLAGRRHVGSSPYGSDG